MVMPLTKEEQMELVRKAWSNLCFKYDCMGTSLADFGQAKELDEKDATWIETCSNYDQMGQQLREFALLLAGVLGAESESREEVS